MLFIFFFFKQKTAYEMRISDWSSDLCSSDLTEFGGELLKIEAIAIPGKGKSTFTGRLGDVMQESIQAAMTVVRSRAKLLGISEDFFQSYDRSEESRVGKACVSKCRYRCTRYH